MDLGAHYRCQDPEKLGQAFDLVCFHSRMWYYYVKNFFPKVRKAFPYLTPERFPQNWAVAEMVKGYIAGTRKERHRQVREDEEARDTMSANKTGYSSDASEPEASSDSSSR